MTAKGRMWEEMHKGEVNCGHCKHHRRNFETGEWECFNPNSVYYRDETDYRECCADYEDKNTRRTAV